MHVIQRFRRKHVDEYFLKINLEYKIKKTKVSEKKQGLQSAIESIKKRTRQPSLTSTTDHRDTGDKDGTTPTNLEKGVGVIGTAEAFGPTNEEQGRRTIYLLTTLPQSKVRSGDTL